MGKGEIRLEISKIKLETFSFQGEEKKGGEWKPQSIIRHVKAGSKKKRSRARSQMV